MAKPFELTLKVEEIALGSVLRKLHDMPGIVSIGMDMPGLGGTGAGVEKLSAAAAANGKTIMERLVEVMAASEGPMHVRDIMPKMTGAKKSSVTQSLYKLKQNGLVKRVGQLTYILTGKQLALPAPAKAPQRSPGRAAPGAGQAILIDLLSAAPMPRSEVGKQLSARGLSEKSISGIVQRCVGAKLIKRTGVGKNKLVELTDKGRKNIPSSQMNGVAHHGN